MGSVLDVLSRHTDWSRHSVTIENPPIVYIRAEDFTVSGNPRPGVKGKWELAMRSMIALDLQTRKLFTPVIEDRMVKMRHRAAYKLDKKIDTILQKFPKWNEQEIYELHDLFQVFETKGDGVIRVTQLILGMENVNDKTPSQVKLDTFSRYDQGTGELRFENFLEMIEMLQKPENIDNPLRQTFQKLHETIRFLKHMSMPQQLLSGFL